MTHTIHGSLREDSDTIHHIVSCEGVLGILATAGLLAEAINFRNGYASSEGRELDLSVVAPAMGSTFTIDEYAISAVGKWRHIERTVRSAKLRAAGG